MCHLLLKTTNRIRLTLKSKQKDVFGVNIPELYFKAKGSRNFGRIFKYHTYTNGRGMVVSALTPRSSSLG